MGFRALETLTCGVRIHTTFGHEALKFIQGQHKLNPHHVKWVEYLQTFNFVIHYKVGQLNKGADALSRRYLLLSVLESKVLRFEIVKGLYAGDENFK